MGKKIVNKRKESLFEKFNNLSSTSKSVIAIVGLLAIIIVSYVANDLYKDYLEEKNSYTALGSTMTVMDGDREADILENINGMLTKMRNGNMYMNLVDGEDSYETYIYNKYGECVAQGSEELYVSVFKNDHTSVRYTDYINTGEDIDVLTLIESAVSAVEDDKARFYKANELKRTDGLDTVYLEVYGWDEIRNLYTVVSDEFADYMIETMQETIPDYATISMIFTFVTGENDEFYVGCDLSIFDTMYTNWYFDGYLLLNDWKLSEDWYTYDFSEAEKSEEMLDTLLTKLKIMFEEYKSENSIIDSSDLDTELNGDNENVE